jgi:hypothetical protein
MNLVEARNRIAVALRRVVRFGDIFASRSSYVAIVVECYVSLSVVRWIDVNLAVEDVC